MAQLKWVIWSGHGHGPGPVSESPVLAPMAQPECHSHSGMPRVTRRRPPWLALARAAISSAQAQDRRSPSARQTRPPALYSDVSDLTQG
jgi:hypothetical protein